MHQLRLFGLLLQPSVLSLATTTFLAGVTLGLANWSRVATSQFFYDYLSLSNILQSAPDGFTAFFNVLFARPLTYNVMIFVVSVVAGLTVYVVLALVERSYGEVAGSLHDVRLARPRSKRAVQTEVGLRLGFRFFTLISWFWYWLFFVKIVGPFCILAFSTGMKTLDASRGWGYVLLAYAILWVGLHLHIIFLRLMLLRPRVFGGGDVVAAGLE